MTFDQLLAAVMIAAIFITPLMAFGAAALRFGADSRPRIDDDRRRWLVPTS